MTSSVYIRRISRLWINSMTRTSDITLHYKFQLYTYVHDDFTRKVNRFRRASGKTSKYLSYSVVQSTTHPRWTIRVPKGKIRTTLAPHQWQPQSAKYSLVVVVTDANFCGSEGSTMMALSPAQKNRKHGKVLHHTGTDRQNWTVLIHHYRRTRTSLCPLSTRVQERPH